MTVQSRARPRRFVSPRVSYDLKTGAFRMPAYIEVAPDEFIANPAVRHLQAAAGKVAPVTHLRILDGGRSNG